KEKARENYNTIKSFVKGTFAENAPIIPVSAQQNVNIDKILEALAQTQIPKKDESKEPIFLIARSFDINKPGTIVKDLHGGVLGGILKQGKLKTGEEIEIKPGVAVKKNNRYFYEPLKTKIINLRKGKDSVSEVLPGASISIETELDPFMTKTDSLTGSVASTYGSLPEITSKVKVKIKLFNEVLGEEKKEKVTELKTKELLMLSVNTTITVGVIEKISGDEIEMNLNIPIIAIKDDNVGIARNIHGHWRLIGFGEILQ
ncbi:MAG: translation initiation factor IF-2 subunit gamma, partial [Nanoarchaeota archaeon]|nr:translation initiation factor IF-2 subunit gamma [Nanoarchaeota archaeon]